MAQQAYPETSVTYSVEVDGERQREQFTTDDVNDNRVAWNPDVADAYAQHLAVETFGTDIDVTTVEIERLGEPDDDKDETGGVAL